MGAKRKAPQSAKRKAHGGKAQGGRQQGAATAASERLSPQSAANVNTHWHI
jgi:hypothetical protein